MKAYKKYFNLYFWCKVEKRLSRNKSVISIFLLKNNSGDDLLRSRIWSWLWLYQKRTPIRLHINIQIKYVWFCHIYFAKKFRVNAGSICFSENTFWNWWREKWLGSRSNPLVSAQIFSQKHQKLLKTFAKLTNLS